MINGQTRVFALLGSSVAHSLSPAMQNAAIRALGLNAVYVPLSCQEPDVPPLMAALARAGGGGNITVPHKEAAACAVAEASERLHICGACNTFWGNDGRISGENTDVDGILFSLDRLEAPATRWLVLGTGGSARAVATAARERGAALAVRSRSPHRRLEFEKWLVARGIRLAIAEECEVLVNATPVGMNPGDALPLALDETPAAVAALDLIYRRQETPWVHAMRRRGMRACDGRDVLVVQGAVAFERWFGERAPVEVMRAAVSAGLR